MSLAAGTRLGPYEIRFKLGEGGMGEVYRAHDTTLNRDVAVKVLPDLFADDPERLARFTREAQTLAALNHPNIAHIYGVESRALVMELVEGEDLAVHIARGAIPLAEALPIARQIAEALEAAHDQGIVHRDLKPANIKVKADGTVKVLDFGLAKALTQDAGPRTQDLSNSPTLTARATQIGVIMGTAAYMAPEQARGKTVDRRADIWAFGVVLFEMLTGQRAFKGDDTSDVLAAVLRQDLDWSALPPATPPRLRRLLERCLDRDPRQRLRDVGEARVEIAKIESGTTDGPATPPAAAAARSTGSRAWSLLKGAFVIALIAAAWWLGRRAAVPEAAWSRFTQLTDASGIETGPSLSPDGASFAYASAARGSWDIYVQRVGGRNPVLVAGDPARDEIWPAFSPDGKSIAYSLGGGTGGIFIVGATGESARRLTDTGSNPAWSPDGQHIVFCSEEVQSVYSTNTESTLWTVDVNGGTPVKLDLDIAAFQPAWSPSGKRIAFWTNINGQRDIATIAATGGSRLLATDDVAVDWGPVWTPDGRFLYFASDRGGSMGIWRMPIDEASGRATGAPEPIAAGVDVSMDLPHLSADGNALVFRSKIQSVNPAAIDFDPATERAGAVRLLQHTTRQLLPASVSPDGRWLALYNLNERQQDIFTMRSDGSALTHLTDDDARDWFPHFAPDGSTVEFISNKGGAYQGWSIRPDGSGRAQITNIDATIDYVFFSPDGRKLVAAGASNNEFFIGSPPFPMTRATATVVKPQALGAGFLFPTNWSRNGRWLAGAIALATGSLRGNGLYDVAAGTVRALSDDSGSFDLGWLPGDTRVVYFTIQGKLVVQDVDSLKRRDVAVTLPLPPDDAWNIAVAPDGRTIYYGAQQVEANIWKVERARAQK